MNARPRPSLVEYRDNPRPRRTSKYGNIHTDVDGVKFDSRAEARRYVDLLWLVKAGKISDLQLQFEFELIPGQARPSGGFERPGYYVCDFLYFDHDKGDWVVEDVKGASPDLWVWKRKLMLHVWGVEVQEVKV